MNLSFKNQIVIFSSIILFFFYFFAYSNNEIFSKKLNWDEVDYALASSDGLASIIFEKNTLNIVDFLKLSKLKLYKDAKSIEEFSKKLIDEEKDSFLLRHYHPIGPIIYWNFFYDEDPNIFSKKIRFSNIIILVLNFFIILFFIKNYIKNSLLFIIITFINLNIFTSEFFMRNYIDMNFHNFYSFFLIFFFYRLSKLLEKNKLINIIKFSISLSLLILSLETFIFSFLSLIMFYFLFKIWKILSFTKILQIIFFTITFLIIINPGIALTLGPIKSWIMYIYRIFFNFNTEHQGVDIINILNELMMRNYFLFVILILSIFILLANKIKNKLLWFYFIHSTVYFTLISSFLMMDRYLMPVIIGQILLFYLSISRSKFLQKVNIKYFFAIIFLLTLGIFNNYNYFNNQKDNSLKYNINVNEVINFINGNQNSTFLIDGGHIYKFYLKNNNIKFLTYPTNEKNPQLLIRENRNYINLADTIEQQYFDHIIVEKRRKYNKQVINILTDNNYVKSELKNYKIFSLSNN